MLHVAPQFLEPRLSLDREHVVSSRRMLARGDTRGFGITPSVLAASSLLAACRTTPASLTFLCLPARARHAGTTSIQRPLWASSRREAGLREIESRASSGF